MKRKDKEPHYQVLGENTKTERTPGRGALEPINLKNFGNMRRSHAKEPSSIRTWDRSKQNLTRVANVRGRG